MSGSIRILHVDDEPDFVDLTATYLQREDDRIIAETATSAANGLDHLTDRTDCVISDYDMPGMNGIEFLETVREQYPDLPFILYTGKGSEEIASEAISAGVTDYLQKGHGTEQYELLANRLTNAVEQARARTQADKHHRVSTVVRDINQALVEATSRDEISHRVCQIISDADPYVFAWIGTVDSATDQVEPQAAAGFDDGYLENITITTDESTTGRGPGGTAIREDRIAVSQNIHDDETFGPWREQALERGYRSVAGIPLSHDDTRYGLLGVYADRPNAFDEAEQELLAELGNTIAHAYHRLEVQQQYEDQYRELFEEAPVMFAFTREVSGEPIIEDCNQLFAETLGYTRQELRGTRLATLYTEESAQALLGGGGYDRALSGEFTREQREFVTSDGTRVTTLLRATPRRDNEGGVIGTHSLFVDITHKNARLSSLFEQFPEPVLAYVHEDGEPHIRQVNEAFTETFGYDAEEAVGEQVDSLLVPPDRQAEAARIDDRVQAGDAVDALLRRETRSGMRDFRFRNISLSTGDTIDGYGIYADVTERRRREEQLKEAQRRFQTLFEQLSQPLVEVDYDGSEPIVTDVNPAFEETFGYDASTIVGESLDAYIVPEDRKDEADDINKYVREGGQLVSREVTRQTANGLREFLLENAVYEDESAGFAIYTDITDRKRREEALNALQEVTPEFMDAQDKQAVAEQAVETARSVLDQPINGLWFHDPNNEELQPVAMTAEAENVVGAPPTYSVGEGLSWEAFADNTVRVYDDVQPHSERFNAETSIRSEIILPLGEHGVLNIGATEPETFSKIDISLARIFGKTVETALDRADREQQLRNQRASLQRQNDRLDKFTGVVSHDLQNPLRVAAVKIKLAQEACESPHLADAANALDRMETLITDLLTIAREGTEVHETEATTLGVLAEESWSCVGTADATLRSGTENTIQADPSRLRQLLENLIRNAVDHGGDDVTVRIGDLEDGFYVADDGPGIPAEERNEVFEAGYSTTAEGTGLGLNIVEEIAEAHGWDISVTESDAGGARFEITDVAVVE
jgi:PAS domain S-box-containing protein